MARKHPHKYYRLELNPGQVVWACALPDCSHYMPVHLERSVLGKNFICWNCDKVSQIKPQHIKFDREYFSELDKNETIHPICTNCVLGISPDEELDITKILDTIK